jgi:hypothetical protein
MNVAITAQGTELDAPVETRFGRARYFLLVDTQTGGFTVHDNVQNVNAPQGAGIQAAQASPTWGRKRCSRGTSAPRHSPRFRQPASRCMSV